MFISSQTIVNTTRNMTKLKVRKLLQLQPLPSRCWVQRFEKNLQLKTMRAGKRGLGYEATYKMTGL